MSWIPAPTDSPIYASAEIPGHLAERYEDICDALRAIQPAGDTREPEDLIALLGLLTAESLAARGQLETLFIDQGEHNDRP